MRFSQFSQLEDQQIPAELRPWLYAEGSLTQQLTALANGQFSINPLSEKYQSLTIRDAQWLGMPAYHLAWIRESYLYGSEQLPWVKARSIFPILSLKKRARIFKHLGKQPIGHFLFQRTTPACQRRVIKLDEGWTRQSCYTWHKCKFIVQETFLPSFEAFIEK